MTPAGASSGDGAAPSVRKIRTIALVGCLVVLIVAIVAFVVLRGDSGSSKNRAESTTTLPRTDEDIQIVACTPTPRIQVHNRGDGAAAYYVEVTVATGENGDGDAPKGSATVDVEAGKTVEHTIDMAEAPDGSTCELTQVVRSPK